MQNHSIVLALSWQISQQKVCKNN